ncbi:MAG: DHA2 family efflux MFS transporter permease subunit, partial [archaeon]|nr:DHA2 family efflux MFS transporter permease subunit [archaeon]
ISTALPSISSDLGISDSLGQWLVSGYSLAMAIMVPVTSFAIKRIPTRKLFLSIIALFTLGLVIDVLAVDFTMLLVGRILQAAANGILIAAAQIVLMAIYPREVHGKVMGWYGITLTAAPIVSPTIAGILIDVSGWRSVFVLPLVVMVVSLVATALTFENVLETEKLKFDPLSFILCAIAFGGLTYGISNAVVNPTGIEFIVPTVLGVVGLALFCKRQSTMEKPFLHVGLFRNRQYCLSMVQCILLYMAIMSTSVLCPVCFQQTLGYSATESGLILIPGTLLVAVLSPVMGTLYDRYGIRTMSVVLCFMMFLSNFPMLFVDCDTSIWVLVGLGVLKGIGGSIMMPITTWCVNSVPSKYRADATSLNNAFRTLGGALGVAVFVALMDSRAADLGAIGAMGETFMLVSFLSLAMVVLTLFAKENFRNKD